MYVCVCVCTFVCVHVCVCARLCMCVCVCVRARVWNPPGPWGTPGQEQVFSFTPSISGAYPIQVTNSGYYVDLFIKTGSCGSSGWTYVSDIFSNETNNVNLTAGVTYLFLIDDENTSPSSGTITVGCPCIPPPGGIDESITVTSNTSYSSTTIGACNDCSLRSSNDRVLEVVIPCAGTYTFTTCNLATWDTYLYLTTAPCGGSTSSIANFPRLRQALVLYQIVDVHTR